MNERRLMLRVPQAAEFCGKSAEEIKAAIKSGALGTRNVDGVAGPHVHADELVAWAGMGTAAVLTVFGLPLPVIGNRRAGKPEVEGE